MFFDTLEGGIRSDIRRILGHLLRDGEPEVRDVARETMKSLKR